MGVIYTIKSPSGKLYVGKTYNLRKRKNAHKDAIKKDKKSIILHNSIRKYGWDAHILTVIEEVGEEKLNEREIFWIAELKTYCYENKMGLNMTRGGDGQRGAKMSEERKKWYSERYKGEGGTFYGKRHTDEAKKLISEKATARHLERGTKIPEWGVEKMLQNKRKPVICYGNNGFFVCEQVSLSEASRRMDISLSSIKDSLIYGSWINGTYLFKYKTENYPLQIEVGEIKVKTEKRSVLTLSPDFEVLCEHDSAQEASDFWGVPKTTINRAAQYNFLKPIRSGHIFIYTDLYAEIEKLTA